MKEIKCYRCKRTVQVRDDYEGSRCPNCKVKDKADSIKKQELRGFDKESQKQIKNLGLQKEKLNSIFKNYSSYAKNYEKYFHKKPTFEEYIEALRQEKIRLAYEQRDRIKRERKRKSSTFIDENWGKEPSSTLEPQYPKEKESYGANAWQEPQPQQEPKPLSNQQKLKTEFDHSE